jgi:hypothetical protein
MTVQRTRCAPSRASVIIAVSQVTGTWESASVLASHSSLGGPAPAGAGAADVTGGDGHYLDIAGGCGDHRGAVLAAIEDDHDPDGYGRAGAVQVAARGGNG